MDFRRKPLTFTEFCEAMNYELSDNAKQLGEMLCNQKEIKFSNPRGPERISMHLTSAKLQAEVTGKGTLFLVYSQTNLENLLACAQRLGFELKPKGEDSKDKLNYITLEEYKKEYGPKVELKLCRHDSKKFDSWKMGKEDAQFNWYLDEPLIYPKKEDLD